jgi:hypothetical protein
VKKHATDRVSLVFALIFASIAGWWAVDRATDFDLDGAWFLVVGLLVVAGITLITTIAKPRPAPAAEPVPESTLEPAVEPAVDSPTEVLDAEPHPERDADAAPTTEQRT